MKTVSTSYQAFTLVEALIVIAAIGVLAGVAIPIVTGVPDAARREKLEQDVAIMNSAIDAYTAAGGDPANLTASGVISALKSRVNSGVAAEMMGPQGPFIELSIVTNSTDFGWGALFTTDPRPRFYVAQGTTGVVFGRGQAAEVGGVAEQSDQDRPGWLWSYADPETPAQSDTIFAPLTLDGSGTFTRSSLTPLASPAFSPPGGIYSLGDFETLGPLQLTDPNPPGSSRIVFSADGGSSWAAYTSPLPLNPGEVIALAVSLDPSRYANSSAVPNTIVGQPVVTWSATNTNMTYSAVLSNVHGLTASADGSGPFEITYTAGGVATNVITLPHPTNWGGNTLSITAQAVVTNGSPYYVDSEPTNTTITAASQVLGTPSMLPPGDYEYVFGSKVVSFVAAPDTPADVSVRFFYTTNGTEPSPENGTEGDFVIISGLLANERVTNRLIATAPTGLEAWFGTSGVATGIYLAPNFDFNSTGLLVGGGTIANRAVVDGSIVLASGSGAVPDVEFGNNSVLDGDIYAPGTPTIQPSIAADRIIDLDGPEQPSNYTITINKASWTGKVYRRITPVTMPVVELPTDLPNQGSATSGYLAPGYYSSVTPPNNGTITLGVADATTPAIYQFDSFNTGNGFTMNIIGPVLLILNPGPGVTASIGKNVATVLGNSAHPEWLQINMFTGNLELGNRASLYGSVLSPNGDVDFLQGSQFTGGVTAKDLTVENNTTVRFSLPPPTQ